MNLKVYLARPISGSEPVDVVRWYKSVSEYLRVLGHTPLLPLVNEGEFRTDIKFKGHGYEGIPTATNHAIFERDQWLVRESDVILVDFSTVPDRASIGCIMELAWASLLGKHTVVVVPPKNLHEHAFIFEAADVVFDELIEALQYIQRLGGKNE